MAKHSTQSAKMLRTGNAAAQDAGKAVSYVVTQETFDAAFHAGRAVAGAFQTAAETLRPLLYPLAARTDDTAVRQWNEYRRAFSLGMAAERGIDPDSARRMFGRIVDFLGFDKPQTLKALAEQKRKAALAPAKPEPSPKDGAGAEAVAAVQMGLSAIEAHLISMVRAKKFTMATQCIAEMAGDA